MDTWTAIVVFGAGAVVGILVGAGTIAIVWQAYERQWRRFDKRGH